MRKVGLFPIVLLLAVVLVQPACEKDDDDLNPETTEQNQKQPESPQDKQAADPTQQPTDQEDPSGPQDPSDPPEPEDTQKQKAIAKAQKKVDEAQKALQAAEAALTQEDRMHPTEEQIILEMNQQLESLAKELMDYGYHKAFMNQILGPNGIVMDGQKLKPYMEEVGRIVETMNDHRTWARYQQMLDLVPSLREQLDYVIHEARREPYASTVRAFAERINTDHLANALRAPAQNPSQGSAERKAVKEIFEHQGYMHFQGTGIPKGPEGSGIPGGKPWSWHIQLIGKYIARFDELQLAQMKTALDEAKKLYDADKYIEYVDKFQNLFDMSVALDGSLVNTSSYVFGNETALKTAAFSYSYVVDKDTDAKRLVDKQKEVKDSPEYKAKLERAAGIKTKKESIEAAKLALQQAEKELADLQAS